MVIPGWGKDTSWFSPDQEGDQEMNSGTTHYPASFQLKTKKFDLWTLSV